jgi:hypothetical protein
MAAMTEPPPRRNPAEINTLHVDDACIVGEEVALVVKPSAGSRRAPGEVTAGPESTAEIK